MTSAFHENLHRYLTENHFRSGGLIGPDPGVRFNYRFWRFLKSALRFIPWQDDMCYMQSQGYWILANWQLSRKPDDPYAKLAIQSSDYVIKSQRPDGAWDFPNPEWRGRVTTVEGIWASLGMMESFRKTGQARYADAVRKWDDFFQAKIGFQTEGDELAVNYFAGKAGSKVPNNSALALRYLARLDATLSHGKNKARMSGLVRFLSRIQSATGELPYEVGNPQMQHFQCFQYHAFMLLDLLDYFLVTQDSAVLPVLQKIAKFLKQGVSSAGDAYYQCGVSYRTVNYHSAAVAAALRDYGRRCPSDNSSITSEGLGDLCDRIDSRLAAQQRADGSLPHSRGDYHLLSDRRSYPRYLAMMLLHSLTSSLDERLTDTARMVNQPHKQPV